MSRDGWDDGIIFEDEEPNVRPFLVGSGKAAPTANVSVESLVESSGTDTLVRFEKRKVLEMASGAISVAELSSHLKMPIGTTMAVIAEMIDEGLLVAHKTADDSDFSELNIMTRIIQRVREL